uniref:ORF234 n=1 Tax=Leptospirillum ferrooxidans TaxID=180 RepID=Q58KG0_9BACT|nr:hypothetical protein [Leptospirillum ferrooxidans]AAX36051.1 ORF234 [Leptospirillum ferrooxidans]
MFFQRVDEEASKRLKGARLEGLEVFRSMEREIGSLEGQIEGLYREREAQDVAALTAAEQERRKTIKEILFCSAPEKNSGLTERREHLEQKYSMTAELRRNIEKQGAEDYMDGLATSLPQWATHIQKNGGLPACIEQMTRVLEGERKKWFKDKDLLSSTTKRLSLLEGFSGGEGEGDGGGRREAAGGTCGGTRPHPEPLGRSPRGMGKPAFGDSFAGGLGPGGGRVPATSGGAGA